MYSHFLIMLFNFLLPLEHKFFPRRNNIRAAEKSMTFSKNSKIKSRNFYSGIDKAIVLCPSQYFNWRWLCQPNLVTSIKKEKGVANNYQSKFHIIDSFSIHTRKDGWHPFDNARNKLANVRAKTKKDWRHGWKA